MAPISFKMSFLCFVCFLLQACFDAVQTKALPTAVYCGLAAGKRQPRIVNGTLAEEAQIPWIVSVKENQKHKCGGTIISSRYILTAGHCFSDHELSKKGKNTIESDDNSYGIRLTALSVTVGEFNQGNSESYSLTLAVKRIVFHEDYKRKPLVNDIVLLEVFDDIEWTKYVQPMCLPSKNILETEAAFAAGWGRDIRYSPEVTREYNNLLRVVKMPVYTTTECHRLYDENRLDIRLSEEQMCAGNYKWIGDTNQGDSGGPLFIIENGRAVLIGITSFGTGQSKLPSLPGIYTCIYKHLDWIKKHIK